jgi:hypothetical protein
MAGPVAVNRHLVGAIALTCLAAGVTIGVTDSYSNLWCGSFIRVGLVMSAFWLALPARGQEQTWASISPLTLLGVLLGLLVFVRRPQVFLPLLVVLAAIGLFLRPRKRSPVPTRRGQRTHRTTVSEGRGGSGSDEIGSTDPAGTA